MEQSPTPQSHALLAQDFTAITERLQQATVQVRAGRRGGGSGVIWDGDGLIVTNAHVVGDTRPTVELWDGRKFSADVLAVDTGRDLASLHIAASNLPAPAIADSSTLRVGQLVMAVGNPLGLSGALTVGIVHAIAPEPGHGQGSWIQADVRLAPGNSGGPLADVLGRVTGINSMVAGGLGLAVPSNAVKRFLSHGTTRAFLGVTTQPVQVPLEGRSAFGLLILATQPESPAEIGGLFVGDILIGSGGRAFGDAHDLGVVLGDAGAGATLSLDILRGGRYTRVDIVTGAVPDTEPRDEAA